MDSSEWVDFYERAAIEAIDLLAVSLDDVVPACPKWTGRDLLRHVGGGPLGWGELMDLEPGGGMPNFLALGERCMAQVPTDDGVLPDWSHEQVRGFAVRLRALGDDTPVWTFCAPHVGRFWTRRTAMEIAVHRRDAQGIAGSPAPVPAEVAADGLDELVEINVPFWFGLGLRAPARSLRLSATDVDGTWLLPGAGGDADPARATGAASNLFLTMWGRERAGLTGDLDVVDEWAHLARVVG